MDSQLLLLTLILKGGWPTTSFEIGQLQEVDKYLKRKNRAKIVTFAQATTNDGQSLLAVNDLFIGPKSHLARFIELEWGTRVSIIF